MGKMKKTMVFLLALTMIFALSTCALSEASANAEGAFAPFKPEALEGGDVPLDPSDISWLTTYLDAVVVGICIVIGLLVKHSTPINNKYIPLIVACTGLVVSVWMHWKDGITPHVILGGLFSGLASTGFHQIFKQLFFSDNT